MRWFETARRVTSEGAARDVPEVTNAKRAIRHMAGRAALGSFQPIESLRT
jgi:hypothetical protein